MSECTTIVVFFYSNIPARNILLLITFTSVLASVIIINFNQKSQKMPIWIETVFLKWIPKLICLPKPEKWTSLKACTLIDQ